MARAVSWPDLYLPVPTISRDRNSRPAMTRGSMKSIVMKPQKLRKLEEEDWRKISKITQLPDYSIAQFLHRGGFQRMGRLVEVLNLLLVFGFDDAPFQL